MKNSFKKMQCLALATASVLYAGAEIKKLPVPEFVGGMPVNEVIAKRQSVRTFDINKTVDDMTLGQLLWMTLGVNRPAAEMPAMGGKSANRSNPTARNWQEISAYIFGTDGVWMYLPEVHGLKKLMDGDYRGLIAGTQGFSQGFVMDAPYSIVFVADLEGLPEDPHVEKMALVDAGIACENLNLACASLGIATVPRATMDSAAISKLLGFSPRKFPIMNNPIGYQK